LHLWFVSECFQSIVRNQVFPTNDGSIHLLKDLSQPYLQDQEKLLRHPFSLKKIKCEYIYTLWWIIWWRLKMIIYSCSYLRMRGSWKVTSNSRIYISTSATYTINVWKSLSLWFKVSWSTSFHWEILLALANQITSHWRYSRFALVRLLIVISWNKLFTFRTLKNLYFWCSSSSIMHPICGSPLIVTYSLRLCLLLRENVDISIWSCAKDILWWG